MQRVTQWWQPATHTNRAPNRDKIIITKSNHPTTSDIYRRQDDVFGTNYSFFCPECRQYFIISITCYREDCLMCCLSNKVNKSDTRSLLALTLGGLHENKLCDSLQAMPPTNVKTVHQISLLHIESNPDRLGLLSPTHGERSQQQSGQIKLQSVLINKPKFLKAKHSFYRNKKIWNTEVHGSGSMVVEA